MLISRVGSRGLASASASATAKATPARVAAPAAVEEECAHGPANAPGPLGCASAPVPYRIVELRVLPTYRLHRWWHEALPTAVTNALDHVGALMDTHTDREAEITDLRHQLQYEREARARQEETQRRETTGNTRLLTDIHTHVTRTLGGCGSGSAHDKGQFGQAWTQQQLEKWFPDCRVTVVGGRGLNMDLLVEFPVHGNGTFRLLVEVKNKKTVTKDDVDQFENDARANFHNAHAALFVSWCSNNVPMRRSAEVSTVGRIPVVYLTRQLADNRGLWLTAQLLQIVYLTHPPAGLDAADRDKRIQQTLDLARQAWAEMQASEKFLAEAQQLEAKATALRAQAHTCARTSVAMLEGLFPPGTVPVRANTPERPACWQAAAPIHGASTTPPGDRKQDTDTHGDRKDGAAISNERKDDHSNTAGTTTGKRGRPCKQVGTPVRSGLSPMDALALFEDQARAQSAGRGAADADDASDDVDESQRNVPSDPRGRSAVL